jgi:hypothetical protein|tara:strand:- start:1504 stop:2004 length:501 start_codon:yes stop_codon:yes gene_type:complete
MSDEREIKLEELHGEMEDSDILDVHVDQILWKICQLENEIHDIKYKQAESKEFYDRRIESVNKQIAYRRNLLESFMQSELQKTGKKTLKMPNGTLKMTTRTSREFGDEKELIKFCYDNNIPTRVTEKPDKKEILKYISTSGDVPMGYTETTDTTFSYKTTNNKEIK